MKLKKYWWISILIITLLLSIKPVYTMQSKPRNILTQASNLTALMSGVYDGDMTFAQLKRLGNFGLGTLDSLDGELVGLDGKFYQVKADGIVYPVTPNMKTPFAAVTFFTKEQMLNLNGTVNYEQMRQSLDKKLLSFNLPYAIRIRSKFPYLKFRSVPKQTPPYKPLEQVLKNQIIFEKRNITGTLVGFRMPSYTKGINVEGYHFHFISDDRKTGGHLIDGEFQKINAEIQILRDVQMMLPSNQAFNQANLQ
jgi:acetolactate decarboxylase